MANKYQLITELYRTTLLSVTETPADMESVSSFCLQ